MNALETAVDKVLRKYWPWENKRSELRENLLDALREQQVSAAKDVAQAMKDWSTISSPDLSAHCEPESAEKAEKTYRISLERNEGRHWQATIFETFASGVYPRFVDKIFGGVMDSRATVLKAAKQLIADLQAPKTVNVVCRDGWVKSV